AKTGATALTWATMSSTEWASRQIGNASMFAKRLNRAALPSITGIAASGLRSPRPRIAEPSETAATVLRLMVRRRASSGCPAVAQAQVGGPAAAGPAGVALDGQAALVLGVLGDRLDHAGHARGVDHREIVAVADRELRLDRQLAAQVGEESAVRDLAELDALELLERLDDLHRVIVAAGEHRDVRPHALGPGGGDVERGDRRPVLLDAAGDVADRCGARRELQTDGDGIADGWHR